MTDTDLSPVERRFLEVLNESMQDMDELHGGLQALIYGESGVGKTVAAMKLAAYLTPPEKLILYIDTAQGYQVRANHPDLLKRKMLRLPYKGELFLLTLADAIKKNNLPNLQNVGSVIFDESTTMQDALLQTVVKGRAKYKRDDVDPDAATQPDYGVTQNKFLDIVRRFAQLDGVNCIHTGHVRSDMGPNGQPVLSPSYLPKLGAKMRQDLALVAYLSLTEDKRILRVHPDKQIVAKCRIGGLDPTVTLGTLAKQAKEWLTGNVPTEDTETVTDAFDTSTAPTDQETDTGMEI